MGCAAGGRVVIEKPFGHDLASARTLNEVVYCAFAERDVFSYRSLSGKEYRSKCAVLPVCEFVSRTYLESPAGSERTDYDGRRLRGTGPRCFLRPDWRLSMGTVWQPDRP